METLLHMENNQNQTKKGRGGKRPGGGRKLGSTNKLTAQRLLQEIAKIDKLAGDARVRSSLALVRG